MYLQKKDNVDDVLWKKDSENQIPYRDLFQRFEYEFSVYNFEKVDVKRLLAFFDLYEKDCQSALDNQLVYPAYDMVLKMSHTFNILDAKNAISLKERVSFIDRVRSKACACATLFLKCYD